MTIQIPKKVKYIFFEGFPSLLTSVVIFPSPSLSKRLKASLNSKISSSESSSFAMVSPTGVVQNWRGCWSIDQTLTTDNQALVRIRNWIAILPNLIHSIGDNSHILHYYINTWYIIITYIQNILYSNLTLITHTEINVIDTYCRTIVSLCL